MPLKTKKLEARNHLMHSQQRGVQYTTLRWENILCCIYQGINYGCQNMHSLAYHLLFHLFDLTRNKRWESKAALAALCLVLPANRGLVVTAKDQQHSIYFEIKTYFSTQDDVIKWKYFPR